MFTPEVFPIGGKALVEGEVRPVFGGYVIPKPLMKKLMRYVIFVGIVDVIVFAVFVVVVFVLLVGVIGRVADDDADLAPVLPLDALDIQFMRALEQNQSTTAIVAEKQRLRDITTTVDGVTTVAALRAMTCQP